jgi:hypothetical protein
LYFSLIYNSGIGFITETNNLVLTGMMNIIKTVFHFEVFKKTQSNAVRTLYLGIVKKVNGSIPGENNSRLFYKLYKDLKDNYLDYQFEKGEFEINASDIINNFIPGNDSNKDILILYFYNYHSRFDDLRNQIQSYKKQETHLEHILPQNWKSKWADYGEFNSNDVISELMKLNHDFSFINTWINLLSEKGDRLKLVHDDLKKNQKHPKESLGQWIGNKLVTHQKVNSIVSNNSWPQKKIGLQATSYIKIPSENLPNVGINNFEDFDYKSIIKRTIYIVDFTLEVLNSKEHGTWEPYQNN